MAKIKFTFEDKSIKDKLIDHVPVGKNILEITEDNDIDLNHNCGGVGACSTCHIYVLEGNELLDEITDTEEDMIDRAINPRLESRLACQCEILDDDSTLVIEIPNQKEIIGHEH